MKKKHGRLLNIFLEAIQEADLDRLKSFLVEEAALWADGGGRIRGAATKPIYGKENIAKFLIASVQFAPQGITSSIEMINLQPSIVLRTKEGKPFVVMMFDVIEDGIQTLRLFGNPEKLAGITPLIS